MISGPHYAKHIWQGHPRTILLDRAYYHEEKSGLWNSMDWVSLGWLRSDGGRAFKRGIGREKPTIRPKRAGTGTIFLKDYGGIEEKADTVRYHPAERKEQESLYKALERHRTAIGYQTTALVQAALFGLDIVCKDIRNIMSEPNWIDLLPYADWHYSEIQSGEFWEHLKNDLYTGYGPHI